LNPFFCFHGNCGKVCPTDFDIFGLSRSTICGCCSLQVSSISVRQVTCYDLYHVLLFLLLLLLFFFLSSAKSLFDTFLGDYWTEINEISQEC
jgi:hypothetical protein